MRVRGNKQIWRVAKHLYDGPGTFWTRDRMNTPSKWMAISGSYRDDFYDMATDLLKKIQCNEFTNGDNHGD